MIESIGEAGTNNYLALDLQHLRQLNTGQSGVWRTNGLVDSCLKELRDNFRRGKRVGGDDRGGLNLRHNEMLAHK